uniref:GLI pathogenesis-related 1 n=1 Tax=Nothobranchius kadleci TaxID=1051664 RepID=A0A1A8BZL8_NOTKA
MKRTRKILVWAWIVLVLEVCSISLPEISDKKFIEDCVKEHNTARSAVSPPASNMLYMTWDEGLAMTARAWARRCEFKHNIYLKDVRSVHPTFHSVGENIWTGAPASSFNTKHAIKRWVNESHDYNFNNNKCAYVCGHYTQVVWADSYKVGCAVQLCTNGVKHFTTSEGALLVCNYGPGGNVNGWPPYNSVGTACSGCRGRCKDRLCRSEERDSQKSYNWTPNWDTASGDSNYWIILVIRLIAVLLTFTAAYGVHYFYPNVFCYE